MDDRTLEFLGIFALACLRLIRRMHLPRAAAMYTATALIGALLLTTLPTAPRAHATSPNPSLIKTTGNVRLNMNPFYDVSKVNYDGVATLNNQILFAGYDPAFGTELYVADSTSGSAHVLKDIASSSVSSNPGNFMRMGNYVYFSATTPTTGYELWRTDGTTAGTKLVSDFYSGIYSASPSHMAVSGNTLYFVCATALYGAELCKSTYDLSTDSDTISVVKDIYANTQDAGITSVVAVGSRVFFDATTGGTGSELWISDGTAVGTTLVSDIYTNNNTTTNPPTAITKLDSSHVVFWAMDNSTGYEPYVSDGTSGGTFRLADIATTAGASSRPPSTYNYQFNVLNGVAYFFATDGTTTKIWKTDGTTIGTVIAASNGGVTQTGGVMWQFNNAFYYAGNCSASIGVELCKFDQSTGQVSLIKDFYSGASSGLSYTTVDIASTETKPAVTVGQKFYFPCINTSGQELCESDGTSAGTVLTKDINTRTATSSGVVRYLVPFHSGFVFPASANSPLSTSFEPFFSDGTANGTYSMVDPNGPTTGADYTMTDPGFSSMTAGNYTFFWGSGTTSDTTSTALWKTDGTTNGTTMVTSALGYTGVGQTSGHVGNYLLLAASGYSVGYELVTVNSLNDTITNIDIYTGSSSSSPKNFWTNAANTLAYFTATTANEATEVWVTDGTVGGTHLLKDIYAGSVFSGANSYPGFYELNGYVYFWAQDGTHGIELWRTDGTSNGTVLFGDLVPGANSSTIFQNTTTPMANVGNNLLMCIAAGSNIGYELFSVDTTATAGSATPTLVKDVASSAYEGGCMRSMTTMGSKAYFIGNDGTTVNPNYELWSTDGTTAGTSIVKEINVSGGTRSAFRSNYMGGDAYGHLLVRGSELIFFAEQTANSTSLWKSDGTSAGTVQLNASLFESTSSDWRGTVLGGKAYFSATTNTHGYEPWVTDGTISGTIQIGNLAAGALSSTPFAFSQLPNGNVFFMARSTWYGVEPFAYDPGTAVDNVTDNFVPNTTTIAPTTTTTLAPTTTTLAPTTTTTTAISSQTITFGSLADRVYGVAPFTVSATSSSGLGVSFSSATTSVCTVSTATVTVVGVGACTINANQAGNGSYSAASQVSRSFAVATKSITMTGVAGINKNYDANVAASINWSGASLVGVVSGDNVSFSTSSYRATFANATAEASKTVTVSGVTLTGTHAANYSLTQPSARATINRAPVTIAANSITTTYGSTYSPSFTATGFAGGDSITPRAFVYQGINGTPFGGSSNLPTGRGQYSVALMSYLFNGVDIMNYIVTRVDGVITITGAAQTITFSPLPDKTIGTAPFTVAATASSRLAVYFTSETPSVCKLANATVTMVATGTCTITAHQVGNTNYSAATNVARSFTVVPKTTIAPTTSASTVLATTTSTISVVLQQWEQEVIDQTIDPTPLRKVPPPQQLPVTAEVLDAAPASAAVVVLNGRIAKPTITTGNAVIKVEVADAIFAVDVRDESGAPRPLTEHSTILVTRGESFHFQASGLSPHRETDMWIYPSTYIGRATTNEKGELSGSFVMPESVVAGDHPIVLTAHTKTGNKVSLAFTATVREPLHTSSHSVIFWLAGLTALFIFFFILWRRRDEEDEEPVPA